MNEQKNALFSVADKTGIVEDAQRLKSLGFTIYGSKGSAKYLNENGVQTIDLKEIVGGDPILGHRVATISRNLYAGLLADLNKPEDMKELKQLGIPVFHLAFVDFYPLKSEISREGSDLASVIEKTDVGGPMMVHACAKGRRIVACNFLDRKKVLDWIEEGEPNKESFLSELAAKAEIYVADYILSSGIYHGSGKYYGVIGEKVRDLRYGENPWQEAMGLFKILGKDDPFGLDKIKWLEGNPGFINLTDFDGALQTLTHIAAAYYKNDLWRDMGFASNEQFPYLAIGVKHGNPCGTAVSAISPEDCLMKMIDGNLISIFGASVVTNFTITKELADMLIHYHAGDTRRPLDVIVAPAINDGGLDILKRKNDKCKIGVLPVLAQLNSDCLDHSILIRKVRGNIIPQNNYDFVLDFNSKDISRYGSNHILFGQDKVDIVIAWAVCCTGNSNTIILVKDQMLIGAGVGQKDRLECCKLAIEIAQEADHIITGAVACSDSFFPFSDGPEKLINAGVNIIFTTSGSIRDKETIDLCESKNVALLMIPNEIGRMFYRH